MKNFTNLLCWLSILLLLVTCKPEKIEPDPLADGKPRLLSIVFPGIPQKNVSIDQKNLIITIKVPSVILMNTEPIITLTENARIMQGGCNAPYEMGVECLAGDNRIVLAYKNDTGQYLKAITTYNIKQVPSGTLEMGVMKEPIVHVLYDDPKPGFYVPMINLYGSKLPTFVELINRETGDKMVLEGNDIRVGFREFVNNLLVVMDNLKNQLPGTYDIDLKMIDGKILRAPQPLTLKKGPAVLSSYNNFIYFGQDAKAGSTFFMEGYNLFEGDITLELTDRYGKKFPLENLVFERYGLRLGIPIPSNLPPGQYVMQLYQNGQTRGTCFRLNVRNANTPDDRIGTIGDDALPCSLQVPVKISRGTGVFFTYAIGAKTPNNPRIKLTPTVTGGNGVYYGSVVPYQLPNPIGPSRLTISSEVPAGLYSATLQYLDSDGQAVAETEPYGQLLEVY